MPCPDDCWSLALQLTLYGLTNGAVVALNAAGFTLAYAVAGQMNLAHGNVFALSTVVVASLARALGVTADTPLPERLAALALLVLVGAASGVVLNLAVERLAFRPFRSDDRLAPLIASVALSFLLLGVAVRWHAATSVPAPGHQGVNLPLLAMPDLIPRVELAGGGLTFTLRDGLVLLLGALLAAGLALTLGRTRLGRLLRAVAEDGELAALLGADPRRARVLAFGLAGALAGFGAAIFAAYYGGTTAQQGLRSGFAAMTAAVLGGVGQPLGALAGGLALGVFASFGDYLLDATWTPVLLLLLLVGLLALRPAGLLAGRAPTEVGQVRALAVPPRVGRTGRLVLAGLLALGLAYPLLAGLFGAARYYDATSALLLVSLSVGLGLVVGFAGLLDLGYAAFFALGGYTAALLTASGSRLAPLLPALLREPWLALPLAGLVAAAGGFAFGLPSVRTRGEYLAIVTLAFGELVPGVVLRLADWTGGPRGLTGVPPLALGPWPADPAVQGYLLALGLAGLLVLAALRLGDSRTGRAWAAVRDDELAAAAAGVAPARARLLAFVLGAGCAGLAGALFAGLFGHVEPEQFDFTLSLMVLAAVVVGGRWGLPGIVLGALGLAAYDRLLLEAATGLLRALGGLLAWAPLQQADLRGDNFALFGLLLYLATLPGAAARAR